MGVKITPRMVTRVNRPSTSVTVGTIAFDSVTGYRYIRVTAGAAIAQYDAVRCNGALSDVRPTSAVDQFVLGSAPAAIASGDGWIQIDGVMTVKVSAGVASAGVPLASSATAGTLAAGATTSLAPKGVSLAAGNAAGSSVLM
jgi:hypothetical protein